MSESWCKHDYFANSFAALAFVRGVAMSTLDVVAVLAKAPTGEAAKSGPWGLATILILCVACYFLFKSMSKHMRRVREEFPARDANASAAGRPAPQPPAQQGDPVVQRADQVRREPGEGDPPATS